MSVSKTTPVIDLFAGPGGLGEGFCRVKGKAAKPAFRIALSIERDAFAHCTLRLRSFYRQFKCGEAPSAYFAHLQGKLNEESLFAAFAEQSVGSQEEAWQAELGVVAAQEVDRRIRTALNGEQDWVLIGGPPCQAYSLAGRARNGKEKNEADSRHFLYREYLRILRKHKPVAFVMENVKGLLSAKVQDDRIVERILNDLIEAGYTLHALGHNVQSRLLGVAVKPHEFVIKSEEFGVPQARHRLIVVGTRDDAHLPSPPKLVRVPKAATLAEALRGLPELRSALSVRDGQDSDDAWSSAIRKHVSDSVVREIRHWTDEATADRVKAAREEVQWQLDTGAEFIKHSSGRKGADSAGLSAWFYSDKVGGVCNHKARSHIGKDLARYLFAACYAEVHERSPLLPDFPAALLPDHRNASGDGVGDTAFADRFRVQLKGSPSTTIVSHISKDGHYFIHHDPTQCRSLTVREAARLQTFPDDYFFKGPRTEQYKQVGNAVPPFLAYQIACSVFAMLDGQGEAEKSDDRQAQLGATKLEHVAHQGA